MAQAAAISRNITTLLPFVALLGLRVDSRLQTHASSKQLRLIAWQAQGMRTTVAPYLRRLHNRTLPMRSNFQAAAMPRKSGSSLNSLQDYDVLIEINATNTSPSVTRTLYAHKEILNANSEFFCAKHSELWAGRAAVQSVEGTDNTPKVILEVEDERSAALAETMVKYMYTKEIEDLGFGDLLNLLQLADQYLVPSLVVECSRKLSLYEIGVILEPNTTWEETLAVLQIPKAALSGEPKLQRMVRLAKYRVRRNIRLLLQARNKAGSSEPGDRTAVAATSASIGVQEPPTAALAAALIDEFLSDYLDLEAVMSDRSMRNEFMSWDPLLVTELLSRDDVKVSSENVILTAAMSWLLAKYVFDHYSYATIRMPDNDQEVKAVFAAVRLPQLRPWFKELLVNSYQQCSWMYLPTGSVEDMLRYLAASANSDAKQQLLQDTGRSSSWARPRQRKAEHSFHISLPVEDLVLQAKSLVQNPLRRQTPAVVIGDGLFVDGLLVQLVWWLERTAPGTAQLRLGFRASLEIITPEGVCKTWASKGCDDLGLQVGVKVRARCDAAAGGAFAELSEEIRGYPLSTANYGPTESWPLFHDLDLGNPLQAVAAVIPQQERTHVPLKVTVEVQ